MPHSGIPLLGMMSEGHQLSNGMVDFTVFYITVKRGFRDSCCNQFSGNLRAVLSSFHLFALLCIFGRNEAKRCGWVGGSEFDQTKSFHSSSCSHLNFIKLQFLGTVSLVENPVCFFAGPPSGEWIRYSGQFQSEAKDLRVGWSQNGRSPKTT